MALGTYSELQASVVSWSSRSDLSTLVPDFIRLAEDRINRSLRVQQMETAHQDTIFDNYITLPSWAVAVKVLWLDSNRDAPLQSRPFEDLLRMGTTGPASAWARQGSDIYFNGDGDVSGVLYKAIPALSDEDDTNWLLTAHPSVYLYATLAELFSYTRNLPQAELWSAKLAATLAEVSGADMRDRHAGPLQARAR